jgi:hypothetical protein
MGKTIKFDNKIVVNNGLLLHIDYFFNCEFNCIILPIPHKCFNISAVRHLILYIMYSEPTEGGIA